MAGRGQLGRAGGTGSWSVGKPGRQCTGAQLPRWRAMSSICSRFRSRLLTALNFEPSITMLAVVRRPVRRQSSTNHSARRRARVAGSTAPGSNSRRCGASAAPSGDRPGAPSRQVSRGRTPARPLLPHRAGEHTASPPFQTARVSRRALACRGGIILLLERVCRMQLGAVLRREALASPGRAARRRASLHCPRECALALLYSAG
jgi:hypothetical protein